MTLHYIEVKFLRKKSDALNAFKEYMARVEKQTGKRIKVIHSDNGRVYVNSFFKNFLNERGIIHQTTVSCSPQQNGIAKRANRTLVEMACCLLENSSLPQSVWTEAINTAACIRNRSPTKILGDVTPFEKWTHRKPAVAHFRTFGCDAVVLQEGPKCSKFAPKGVKHTFVGYADFTKGYRLYNRETNQINIARDVIFFENKDEAWKVAEKQNDDNCSVFEMNLPGINTIVREESSPNSATTEFKPAEIIVEESAEDVAESSTGEESDLGNSPTQSKDCFQNPVFNSYVTCYHRKSSNIN